MANIHPAMMELIARDMGVNTTVGYEILSSGTFGAQGLINELTGTVLLWSFVLGIIAFIVMALIMTDEENGHFDISEKFIASLAAAFIVFVIAMIVIGSYYAIMYSSIESHRLPEFVQLKGIAARYGIFNI